MTAQSSLERQTTQLEILTDRIALLEESINQLNQGVLTIATTSTGREVSSRGNSLPVMEDHDSTLPGVEDLLAGATASFRESMLQETEELLGLVRDVATSARDVASTMSVTDAEEALRLPTESEGGPQVHRPSDLCSDSAQEDADSRSPSSESSHRSRPLLRTEPKSDVSSWLRGVKRTENGNDHRYGRAKMLVEKSRVVLGMGRVGEAMVCLEEALVIAYNTARPYSQADTERANDAIGNAAIELEEPTPAVLCSAQLYPNLSFRLAKAWLQRAKKLVELELYKEALPILEKTADAWNRTVLYGLRSSFDTSLRLDTLLTLATSLVKTDPFSVRAESILEELFQSGHLSQSQRTVVYQLFAEAYLHQGRQKLRAAKRFAGKAARDSTKLYGHEHPETLESISLLTVILRRLGDSDQALWMEKLPKDFEIPWLATQYRLERFQCQVFDLVKQSKIETAAELTVAFLMTNYEYLEPEHCTDMPLCWTCVRRVVEMNEGKLWGCTHEICGSCHKLHPTGAVIEFLSGSTPVGVTGIGCATDIMWLIQRREADAQLPPLNQLDFSILLCYACRGSYPEVAELLLEKLDLNRPTWCEETLRGALQLIAELPANLLHLPFEEQVAVKNSFGTVAVTALDMIEGSRIFGQMLAAEIWKDGIIHQKFLYGLVVKLATTRTPTVSRSIGWQQTLRAITSSLSEHMITGVLSLMAKSMLWRLFYLRATLSTPAFHAVTEAWFNQFHYLAREAAHETTHDIFGGTPHRRAHHRAHSVNRPTNH